MSSIFTYEHAKVPGNCDVLLSPSQLSKFFEFPKVWYEENILGKESDFKGNTSSVLGTICHHIYECVTTNTPVTREAINEELIKHFTDNPNSDVNIQEVMDLYPKITSSVVNGYILPRNRICSVKVEQQIVHELSKGIYIAGTYDRLELDKSEGISVLCDFKTVSTKPNTTTIPFHYKIQLLSYAYALERKGMPVDYIRLIYGVRPTKTIPARCITVTEEYDSNAEDLIVKTLTLVRDSINIIREKPELTYLIFKSMDLKEKN
jgi:hypothetical protein